MKSILIACVLTVGLLSGGPLLRAADGELNPPLSQVPKAKRMPFYGQVKAVDTKAKTLTLVGKEKDRVFRITEATRIHDSGTTKALKDVQIGRKVGGSARENAAGQWEIATLNLGVKQERTPVGEAVDEPATE